MSRTSFAHIPKSNSMKAVPGAKYFISRKSLVHIPKEEKVGLGMVWMAPDGLKMVQDGLKMAQDGFKIASTKTTNTWN